jgi:hypothetical protein
MKLGDDAFWHIAVVPVSLRVRPLLKADQPEPPAIAAPTGEPISQRPWGAFAC